MNPLDSAEVIRQEMFSGAEIAGNLEVGHLTQKAQGGSFVEQVMETKLKESIKLGNLTQKS